MPVFQALVFGHVIVGTVALVSFWIPVVSRKGGAAHRKWGRVFKVALYAAAWFAIGMAVLNLTTANNRHPVLTDRRLFDGLFGWMMLYLGVLTLGLGHYGIEAARNRRDHSAMKAPFNIAIQLCVIVAALNCGVRGYVLGQPLMIGLSALGFGAATTFLIAIMRPSGSPQGYVREHLKAMVGAGIAAYTAFLSVGLLQIVPDYVFNPAIWSIPSLVGIGLILVHFRRIDRQAITQP
jgi:hypothetical protein